MRSTASALLALLAVVAAVFVFQLKGTVREVERELAQTRRAIDEANWRRQSLEADFAYLTRPERLAMQAQGLDMVPGTSRELVTAEGVAPDQLLQLEGRVLAVSLADGAPVQLRLKPARAAVRRLALAADAPGQ